MRKVMIAILAGLSILACNDIDTEYKPQLDSPAVLSIVSLTDLSDTLVLTEPATATVRLVVSAESVSDQPLKVSMTVLPEKVSEFNSAHESSFSLLPGESYVLDTEPVIMPRYAKRSSDFSVIIDSKQIPDKQTYILPISIGTVIGSDNVMESGTNSTVFLFVRKKVLSAPVLLDRKDWSLVYCSSESTGETNKGILTGFAFHMLDGDNQTYWNYNPQAPEEIRYAPFYIVFDLGKEVTVRGFEFVNRLKDITDPDSGPRTPPHTVTMQLAHELSSGNGMNDDDYFVSEDFGPSDLPFQTVQDIYLSGAYAARYVRFIWKGAYNQSATAITPGNKGASLAEFYVWGNDGISDDVSQDGHKDFSVVFIGDSITKLWADYDPDWFSANKYICKGISGQTSTTILNRFDSDVTALKPAAAVILCGTNDIAHNTGYVEEDGIMDNIKEMVSRAKAAGIVPVLSSVPPCKEFFWNTSIEPVEPIKSLNAKIKAYAESSDLHYADYWTVLADSEGGMKTEYTRSQDASANRPDDYCHPCKAGYKVMEPVIEPILSEIKTGLGL